MFKSDSPGVFLIRSGDVRVYAGGTNNLSERLSVLNDNPKWKDAFELDSVFVAPNSKKYSENNALKSILFQKESPILNIC